MANTPSTTFSEQASHPLLLCSTISPVHSDVRIMMWSLGLYGIRRYARQRFWEKETDDAERYFNRDCLVPLESVAEHSWHVADTVSLWGNRFYPLDVPRAVLLAVVHDKLEIITGDYDPLGQQGDGQDTHAFCDDKRRLKEYAEESAALEYAEMLCPSVRSQIMTPIHELLTGETREARFVRAVDKIQALAFVITRKNCRLEYQHLCLR